MSPLSVGESPGANCPVAGVAADQLVPTGAGIMPVVSIRAKRLGKKWSRASWRIFRNYFVSRAAASGMSLMHIMEATGHDSYEMVRHYFRLNEDSYRNDFKKFDSGLTAVDLTCRGLTQAGNTLGTHSTRRPALNPKRCRFVRLRSSG